MSCAPSLTITPGKGRPQKIKIKKTIWRNKIIEKFWLSCIVNEIPTSVLLFGPNGIDQGNQRVESIESSFHTQTWDETNYGLYTTDKIQPSKELEHITKWMTFWDIPSRVTMPIFFLQKAMIPPPPNKPETEARHSPNSLSSPCKSDDTFLHWL